MYMYIFVVSLCILYIGVAWLSWLLSYVIQSNFVVVLSSLNLTDAVSRVGLHSSHNELKDTVLQVWSDYCATDCIVCFF